MDRFSFGFVCRAGVHLVKGLGRCAYLEAAERFCGTLAPADHLGHAGDGFGAELLREVSHQLHRIAVEDHRFVAVVAEINRLHLGIDGRQGIKPELFGDLRGGGKLHGTGDLVTESIDQLDRGRHATGVSVGLQAQRPQAGALQDRGRGQPVVPCADHDRVIAAS